MQPKQSDVCVVRGTLSVPGFKMFFPEEDPETSPSFVANVWNSASDTLPALFVMYHNGYYTSHMVVPRAWLEEFARWLLDQSPAPADRA